MSNPSISGPGDGFFGQKTWDERMSCAAAFSKGQVVQVDESTIDATTKAQTHVEAIDATGIEHGTLCVLLEDIAAGGSGLCRFRGRVHALHSGATAVGVLLGVTTAEVFAAAPAAGKVVGKTLETGSTTVPTLIDFDGVNGFGNNVS
jgi:hypothetical protein